MSDALLKKVDCIRLRVPDLETGLAFYRDRLGHELIWRSDKAAGLRMPDSDAELVLQSDDPGPEVDFLVASADAAVDRFVAAGGQVVLAPFDIQIGRAAVVADPWGNRYILLDMSKGALLTDERGNIMGNQPV